jgi:hypothetical protein
VSIIWTRFLALIKHADDPIIGEIEDAAYIRRAVIKRAPGGRALKEPKK